MCLPRCACRCGRLYRRPQRVYTTCLPLFDGADDVDGFLFADAHGGHFYKKSIQSINYSMFNIMSLVETYHN